MQTKEIRDLILEALKKLGSTTAVENNGNYFSAMDIAINNNNSNPEYFRVAVISHK